MCMVNCTLQIVHCIMYIVQCAVYTLHLYSVLFTMYNVQCITYMYGIELMKILRNYFHGSDAISDTAIESLSSLFVFIRFMVLYSV